MCSTKSRAVSCGVGRWQPSIASNNRKDDVDDNGWSHDDEGDVHDDGAGSADAALPWRWRRH